MHLVRMCVQHTKQREDLVFEYRELRNTILKNESIVDVADAITEEQRQLKPWMGEIFGLMASVIVPPPQRTLAASSFESNIATLGHRRHRQRFCYDGLLESARHATAEVGIIVTFIDTSDHRHQALQKFGTLWVNRLGLDLMQRSPRSRTRHSPSDWSPHTRLMRTKLTSKRRQRLPIE